MQTYTLEARQKHTRSIRSRRRSAALRLIRRASLRSRTGGRRLTLGASSSRLSAAVVGGRSTGSARVGSSNTGGSAAAHIIEVTGARSEALAVLLGVLGTAVALRALIGRALERGIDLGLVGEGHVDTLRLAVDVAVGAGGEACCGRVRGGAGARGGVACLALGGGEA